MVGLGRPWVSTGWAPISLPVHGCRAGCSDTGQLWGAMEGWQPGRCEGSGGRSPEGGSWGCSGCAPMLQLCPLPAYVGNADMIQPDLAPLQPSLDDMEISGKSQPGCGTTSHTAQHALHPMAAQNGGDQRVGQAAAGAAGAARKHWASTGTEKAACMGKGAAAGCGAGAWHACLHPGAEPQQVGRGLARSCGRGFLQTEGLSRSVKPPHFGCRQRKDNCPPQERGNL